MRVSLKDRVYEIALFGSIESMQKRFQIKVIMHARKPFSNQLE